MKSYSSREVIRILKEHGWYEAGCVGDHHHFKHHKIPGKITITHPVKDVPIHILKNIEKQTGIKFYK